MLWYVVILTQADPPLLIPLKVLQELELPQTGEWSNYQPSKIRITSKKDKTVRPTLSTGPACNLIYLCIYTYRIFHSDCISVWCVRTAFQRAVVLEQTQTALLQRNQKHILPMNLEVAIQRITFESDMARLWWSCLVIVSIFGKRLWMEIWSVFCYFFSHVGWLTSSWFLW